MRMKLAIIGGGPSGLFMYKRLCEEISTDLTVDIFEKSAQLGAGMPYSRSGARTEHITNVSGNEIPKLPQSVSEWIRTTDPNRLVPYNIVPDQFNEYKVLPRLLFGEYLNDQFKTLIRQAKDKGVKTTVYYNSEVTDINDDEADNKVLISVDKEVYTYDGVIICTGHQWPQKHENTISGYFDSPYPPSKISSVNVNYPVALKGASLTAIDAIRTLARTHGVFSKKEDGMPVYQLKEENPDFRLVMHSRSGLLPAIRFHLDDTRLGRDQILAPEDITAHREQNNGFLALDFIFEHNFKEPLREKDPEFYETIRDMKVEEFVEMIFTKRESIEPFQLFKAEYNEALKSIKRKESIHWKELLAVLSYTMNYPAKYFSAEDMLRLQKVLMPLIGLVIAFVPQSSVEELIALHDAGILQLVNVGDDSSVEIHDTLGATYHYHDEDGKKISVYYKMFVDCTGQPHLHYEDFPYVGLNEKKIVSPAKVRFRSADEGKKECEKGNTLVSRDQDENYFLRVPGIAVNDHFQVLNAYNGYNERIYIMAVPFIGGYNPDYSGLDFCETASLSIAKAIKNILCISYS